MDVRHIQVLQYYDAHHRHMPDYSAHHCRMPNHGGRKLAEYVAMTAQLKKKWLDPFSSGKSGGVEYDPVQRPDGNLTEFTPLICPCTNEPTTPTQMSNYVPNKWLRTRWVVMYPQATLSLSLYDAVAQ